MSRSLVTVSEADELLGGLECVEPAFCIQGTTRLLPRTSGWGGMAADYLVHAVAGSPGDLRTHVQRIHLHLSNGERAETYGAMVDLFIVLRDKGQDLRERMLNLTAPILDDEQVHVLTAGIKGTLLATDRIPVAVSSVLTKWIGGTRLLVERNNNQNGKSQDPMIEVMEYLEYSQVDEAQQVLEAAVLTNPWRIDLHRELLEIYRHQEDHEFFFIMRERLQDIHNPVRGEWESLALEFAKGGNIDGESLKNANAGVYSGAESTDAQRAGPVLQEFL